MIKKLIESKVFYSQASSTGVQGKAKKKVDGRRNNGRNLTTADRSKGGRIAHLHGAHEFTPEEARIAGHKGGLSRSKNASMANENRQE